MITESPNTLFTLLAVLTLLGCVMGYCVALIFAKRQARKAIELARLELDQKQPLAEPHQQADKSSVGELHSSAINQENTSADEPRIQQQAIRIQDLEAEVASLEEKQRRLSQDFASYKSRKNKELERATGYSGQWAASAELPVLTQKADSNAERGSSGAALPRSSVAQNETLNHPLTQEIDIPTLAESELSDSLDELDFDMFGESGSGARGRG
ncbi:MAG: hypothetical protein AB8B87_08875 [Granulosicoccus sp.]